MKIIILFKMITFLNDCILLYSCFSKLPKNCYIRYMYCEFKLQKKVPEVIFLDQCFQWLYNRPCNLFQDSIIETIRKTKCHFIHCLLPQHNAGLWELKQGSTPQDKPSDENLMNVPLIRSQIRGAELLEGVRIYRQGRQLGESFLCLQNEITHEFYAFVNSDVKKKEIMIKSFLYVHDLLCLDCIHFFSKFCEIGQLLKINQLNAKVRNGK